MKATEVRSMFVACVDGLAQRIAHGDQNSRVKAMRKEHGLFNLEDKGCAYLAQAGIKADVLRAIMNPAGNPTVPYRFAQFVNAMHAGTHKQIDLTTARALLALRDAGGSLNRDALGYVLTGKARADGVNSKGVSLTKLDHIVGRVDRGTVETQLSRSFGSTGFCTALGMTVAVGARNADVTVNAESTLAKRFYALIDSATEAQLREMGEK
jgi:hypothetical protein